MWMNSYDRRELVKKVSSTFSCFGGGKENVNNYNPISIALVDKPPMFAAGVDIREVVDFIVDNIIEED